MAGRLYLNNMGSITLPTNDMIKEIIDYIMSEEVDAKKCIALLKKNPWKAVSMYEAQVYPMAIGLPLAYADGTFDENKLMADEVEAFMDLKPFFPTQPRAPKGQYEVDGKTINVNMWGRVLNPGVIWDDGEE